MTTEAERLAEQMRRAAFGGAWHGPSVLEAVAGLSAADAASRPVPGGMTAAEIVAHLVSDQDVVRRRLAGEPVHAEDGQFDPPGDWAALLERFRAQEEDLCAAVAALPDARLLEPIAPGMQSAYETFHGHAQHNCYHAGQLRMLRRLLGAAPP